MKVILPNVVSKALSFPAKKEHAEPLVGRTQLPRPKLQLVVAAAWTQDMLGLLKTISKSDPCF